MKVPRLWSFARLVSKARRAMKRKAHDQDSGAPGPYPGLQLPSADTDPDRSPERDAGSPQPANKKTADSRPTRVILTRFPTFQTICPPGQTTADSPGLFSVSPTVFRLPLGIAGLLGMACRSAGAVIMLVVMSLVKSLCVFYLGGKCKTRFNVI